MGFFGVFYLVGYGSIGMFEEYQKQILKVLHVPETKTSQKISGNNARIRVRSDFVCGSEQR
jgi:hypothetical protein